MCELLMLRYTRSSNYIACIALSIAEEETTGLCSASHSRKTIECIVLRDVRVNRVAKTKNVVQDLAFIEIVLVAET